MCVCVYNKKKKKNLSRLPITNFQKADKYGILFARNILHEIYIKESYIYYILMSDYKILNKCYQIKCCNLC